MLLNVSRDVPSPGRPLAVIRSRLTNKVLQPADHAELLYGAGSLAGDCVLEVWRGTPDCWRTANLLGVGSRWT